MQVKLDCHPDVARMLRDAHFNEAFPYHEIREAEEAREALQRWPLARETDPDRAQTTRKIP